MAYVVKEDIIASIDAPVNIMQGSANTYEILLQRDLLGNELPAKLVSVISISVLNREGGKVLMYANPLAPGVSDELKIVDPVTNPGLISFEINEMQSRYLEPGDLFIQLTLIYSNYYPNAKTYIMPLLKIGQTIENPNIVIVPGDPTPGAPPPPDGSSTSLFNSSPQFMIEHIDLDMPSSYGKMSIDTGVPAEVTKILFKNLDINKTRNTTLENFVVNRLENDKINGIITLYDLDDSTFYCIYRITGWSRVDIVAGNGDADDSDGIQIEVVLESMSSGPGVSKSSWYMGDNVAYSIDTYSTIDPALKSKGILTYTDKNLQIQLSTDGNNSPTGVYITNSPYYDSYVMVEVNGISVEVGDNKDTSSVYFSGNNGATPIEIEAIRAGDQLIWNGDIAGFELEAGDDINFIYEVDVDDLR
ncbi:hypothetical protein N8Z10_00975 [bacterium]|nr:hypothetical protein [bacterium]